MITFIGYAGLAAAFLWVCWQVAGAYTDYRERGYELEEAEEINDTLIAKVRDLSYEKGELQFDNRELMKDVSRLRNENERIRKEALAATDELSKN